MCVINLFIANQTIPTNSNESKRKEGSRWMKSVAIHYFLSPRCDVRMFPSNDVTLDFPSRWKSEWGTAAAAAAAACFTIRKLDRLRPHVALVFLSICLLYLCISLRLRFPSLSICFALQCLSDCNCCLCLSVCL